MFYELSKSHTLNHKGKKFSVRGPLNAARTPQGRKTRDEAQAKFDELQALIDPLSGLAMLHSYLGDLSAYDVDGPVPEVEISSNQVRSIAENLLHWRVKTSCVSGSFIRRWWREMAVVC
jgi:alkanesulfonate monooxygenase SsuD/methylene tetrahydromethanopterin reductase-like flavin-dependent oxidoreductase (luciferase family)